MLLWYINRVSLFNYIMFNGVIKRFTQKPGAKHILIRLMETRRIKILMIDTYFEPVDRNGFHL